jgi:hypothetical protein
VKVVAYSSNIVERLPIEENIVDSTVRKYTRESSFPGGFCNGITCFTPQKLKVQIHQVID